MKKIHIIGIVGASCVGKSTQIGLLLQHFAGLLRFSVSATTRPIRPEKEKNGVHYHFLTLEKFMALKAAGEFLETNQFVNGHWYGTLKSELDAASAEGKILLLDMEYEGAKDVYRQYPEESIFIFLDVSDKEAVQRMETSITGSRESVPERLADIAKQRALANDAGFFCRLIDTTGMKIEFVFNNIANKINEEIKYRDSTKIGSLTTA